MTDTNQNDDLADDGDLPEPLGTWERMCALAVGSVCGGAGGYAVFERSNQAGTVMLLILAATFLLIGVQGTPLIKFGSNSGSLELERRRRVKVQQALQQANEEQNAEKAEGIVEGVKIVAPDLVPRSLDIYKNYEDSAANALSSMGYTISREQQTRGIRPDLKITRDSSTVYAEFKYYTRPVPLTVINQVVGMATILSAPVLLITSSELSFEARKLVDDIAIVDFVQWRNDNDNPQLRATLERLLTVSQP